jgi:hypothetical protein
MAITIGLGSGSILPLLATRTSPLTAAMLMVGLVVGAAALIWPLLNLYLLAVLAPLERWGRFTSDQVTFTFSIMRAMGLLSVGAVLLHAFLARKKLKSPDTILWFSSYFGLGVISLAWSTDHHFGINQTGMHLGTVLFLIVIVNVVETLRQARITLAIWLLTTALLSAYTTYKWHTSSDRGSDDAIVQAEDYYDRGEGLTTKERFAVIIYDPQTRESEHQRRAIGSTSHPGAYGLNLALALPFFIYFFRTESNALVRLLVLAGGVLSAYNMILTNTRAVMLTLLVTLLICLLNGLMKIRPVFLALGAVAAGIAFWFMPDDLKGRTFRFDNWFETSRESSFGERLHLMRVSVELFAENPLFGMGMGNQVDIAKLGDVDWRDRSRSAHNDLLTLLSESGLVGFACMTACLVTFYRRSRFLQRVGLARQDPCIYFLGPAAHAVLWTLLFFGVQADSLSLSIKGFWLVVGIVVALSQSLTDFAKQGPEEPAIAPMSTPKLLHGHS